MKWDKVLRKAVATTIQSATGALIGNGIDLVDLSAWELAAIAGLGGLVTFVHRTATTYLEEQAEGDERIRSLIDPQP